MGKFLKVSIFFFLILFLINLLATPFWRITHDSVFIHYMTFLMDKFNYIPYKEIYDTSMPGTFLFHLLIGKIFGYTESALQLFNLIFTLAFAIINWFYLKGQQSQTRIIGSIYFLLIYQSFGLEMSLQRDFIAAFFILLSIVTIKMEINLKAKNFLSGVALGITAMIKPQLAIGLPLIFLIGENFNLSNKKEFLKNGIIFILGFIFFISLTFYWIHGLGGLSDFWEMQKTYIPQYLQLNADHQFVQSKLTRFVNNIKKFFYLIPYWRMAFFCLVFGTFLNLRYDNKNKSFWITNLVLAILYAMTLIISGQYFPYHFMTFFLFSFFPITAFFNSQISKKYIQFSFIAVITLIINNLGQFPIETLTWLKGEKPYISYDGRVDRLTQALKDTIKENDTIQIFDWIEGATAHALLNLKRPHHSKFITDHIFKHHLHLPSKKKLNKDFLNEMKAKRPTIIIKSLNHNFPSGDFTSKDLPSRFLKFIKKNYGPIHQDKDFIIYRLKG